MGTSLRRNSRVICRKEFIVSLLALTCSIIISDSSLQMGWSDRPFWYLNNFLPQHRTLDSNCLLSDTNLVRGRNGPMCLLVQRLAFRFPIS